MWSPAALLTCHGTVTHNSTVLRGNHDFFLKILGLPCALNASIAFPTVWQVCNYHSCKLLFKKLQLAHEAIKGYELQDLQQEYAREHFCQRVDNGESCFSSIEMLIHCTAVKWCACLLIYNSLFKIFLFQSVLPFKIMTWHYKNSGQQNREKYIWLSFVRDTGRHKGEWLQPMKT